MKKSNNGTARSWRAASNQSPIEKKSNVHKRPTASDEVAWSGGSWNYRGIV